MTLNQEKESGVQSEQAFLTAITTAISSPNPNHQQNSTHELPLKHFGARYKTLDARPTIIIGFIVSRAKTLEQKNQEKESCVQSFSKNIAFRIGMLYSI